MKNNRKGFTLAELLIVVAIIAVLTAVAIPVFTSQLERSRDATDAANLRAAYGQAVSAFLGGADITTEDSATGYTYTANTRTFTGTLKQEGTDGEWSGNIEFAQIGHDWPNPNANGSDDYTLTIVFNAKGGIETFNWGSGSGSASGT